MGFYRGPNVVTNGLVLNLDAANTKSYVSGSTTWRDLSGNGNNGTLVNGPTFSSNYGGGIVFNGSNQYVTLGTYSNMGITNRTYNTWFLVNTTGASNRILTFPADDTSTDTPAYTSGVTTIGTSAGLGGPPYDGYPSNYNNVFAFGNKQWINIQSTITGKTVLNYINGVFIASATSTGTVSTNPIGYIGRYNGNYGQYFSGTIASVSIYYRALSAAEVAQNYNAQKSRFNL
jgi:hypothetical protein